MPPGTDHAELQRRVDAHVWFHSMRLAPGVVTRGVKSEEIIQAESDAVFAGVAFEGASVLDIGAWNGHFSFEAKRRGAARVLATDSVCWTDPRYRGRETIELARQALGLDIELQAMVPHELDPALHGTFDIVLLLGVFYHLLDPLSLLPRLRAATGKLLLLETLLEARDTLRPQMVFLPGAEGGDASNWWGPNIACMFHLLRIHGFSRILFREHPCGLP